MRTTLRCTLERDEAGESEEFTNDIDYVTNAEDLTHLQSNGLPKVGARVIPGMVVVGKLGRRKGASPGRMNELELLSATERELQDYYREWLYDGSLYVPDGCVGKVVSASVTTIEGVTQAVVEIDIDET